MCNLYSLTTTQTAMRQLFGVKRDSLGNHPPLPAIFPGHDAPVVRLGADGDRELTRMHWGFVLPQKGRVPKDVTNARDDKVRISRFWASSMSPARSIASIHHVRLQHGPQDSNAALPTELFSRSCNRADCSGSARIRASVLS